ncbi:MAG: RluA family pseudouridine synthase [Actinomycetota bacterium]
MTEQYEVPAALVGERVDRAVALLTGWTRVDVQALIADRQVEIDGRPVIKSRRLEEGEVIDVLAEPEPVGPPQPEDIPILERWIDDDVIVISKPPGLVVHPGAGNPDGTLANALLHHHPELAGVGEPARPGIVHRLDRDTSGLMLVARTDRAYAALVAALADHEVERRYFALVWGVPEAPRGVIDAPIGRSIRVPTRMAVRQGGRPARTHYEVVESYADPEVSLLECTLETGRTHQIRVHVAAIGHPVVGDVAYGGNRPSLPMDRPFLHAAALGFDHPVTGDRVEITEPLPTEMQSILAGLEPSG